MEHKMSVTQFGCATCGKDLSGLFSKDDAEALYVCRECIENGVLDGEIDDTP